MRASRHHTLLGEVSRKHEEKTSVDVVGRDRATLNISSKDEKHLEQKERKQLGRDLLLILATRPFRSAYLRRSSAPAVRCYSSRMDFVADRYSTAPETQHLLHQARKTMARHFVSGAQRSEVVPAGDG